MIGTPVLNHYWVEGQSGIVYLNVTHITQVDKLFYEVTKEKSNE